MKLSKHLISGLGWYGAAAIILAYAMVAWGVVDANSLVYNLLNLTGAAGVIIEASSKGDKQPVVINIFWALIALIALARLALS